MSALKHTFDYCFYEKVKEDVTDTDIWYNCSKWNIEGLVIGKIHHQ